jgi:hypothetical protein
MDAAARGHVSVCREACRAGVNQIVRGFPELTFGAVFIGSRRSDYGE